MGSSSHGEPRWEPLVLTRIPHLDSVRIA